jgi:ribonuclease Z
MEPIKITFLGTGSAIPTKTHNHSALLITYKDENLLFDCGEGTQRQFKYADLSASKVTKLFITHWHGDHILGIPGLLQTLVMSDYPNKLQVYGPRGTKHFMSIILDTFIFQGKLDCEVHEISSGKVFEDKDILIEAHEMVHGTQTFSYSFIEKAKRRLDKAKLKKLKLPNSPLLRDLQQGKDINFKGKKIKAKDVSYNQPQRKITIIMDTKMNENAINAAKEADILISEASYMKDEQQRATEREHLTASDAATIAKKAKAKTLYLTHLSQRYEGIPHIVEKEAKKIFKNTKLAKDLDTIEI